MQPSKEKIEQIKAQFPDRELHEVTAVDDKEQVMVFIMTSPERGEYKIFVEKLMEVSSLKTESEQLWKVREVVENAALAQIRWPDREECQKAFRLKPEMIDKFSDELRRQAGSQIELRSKKL